MTERVLGDYIIGHTLGEGGFSKVKLGTHIKTGEKVALKLLHTSKLAMNESSKKQVEAEILAMSKVKHPHVIRLKHVDWQARYTKKNGTTQDVMLVVLELATGGELFEFLQHTGSFEEAVARSYFHQLISGVGYCHSQGVAHRDLKPENLLMDTNFVLKLADFGFAKVTENAKLMYTQCGTPGYMAPEMFEHQGYTALKADVWACGVILFIMFAGFPPFQSPKTTDWWFHKLKNNRHDLFWRAHCRTVYFSDGFKDLINKILCPDPNMRISLEDIQKHEWYNGDVMNDQALFAEMQTRKTQVNEKKARERMTKMAKEQDGVVGMNIDALHRALGDDFDFPGMPPSMEFYSQAKGRGGGGMEFGGMGSASDDASGTASVYNPDRAGTIYTHFQSTCAAHELYGRLLVLIKSSCAGFSSKPSSFKIKGTTLSDSGGLTFVAQVFRDASSSRHHVEFKRLSGDGVQFRAIYYMIKDQMEDMILEDKTEEAKRE
jgi:serine/threonine protein kinase